jgi:dihydrofolate reductase
MRKIIAVFNMTLDGFCDHTHGVADEELHRYYTDRLNNAGVILYGRTTYQLMEYWLTVLEKPTGDKAADEFAIAIDKLPKIIFSNTLGAPSWKTATVAKRDLKEEVLALKQQPGGDILVGSPSLIVALTKLKLIDEYELCIHPVIVGKGLTLFRDINETVALKLLKTKISGAGHVTVFYETIRN